MAKSIKKIEDLSFDSQNINKGSEFGTALLHKSLQEVGAGRSVLADKNGVLIAGNKTVEAAGQLGISKVKVVQTTGDEIVVVQRTDLDINSPEGAKMKILDNTVSKHNYIEDAEVMEAVCEEYQIEPVAYGLTPTEEEQQAEAKEDDYEVPDTIQTDIVLGDLFEIGPHRLLCGDSTDLEAIEKLMNGKKADFCFTSPPYNAARGQGSKTDRLGGNGFYGDGYTDDKTSEEYVQFNKDIFASLYHAANEDFTLCYNINYNKNSPSEYIDVVAAGKAIVPLVETIVWEKQMAISLQGDNLTRIFEFVFVFAKGKFKINKNRTECLKNLWKINNVGANHSIHKACFPVKLVEEGIKNFCVHGGTIIEPFGGSGTTMVAAHQLGCKAYMMELDPKYCQVIVDRMRKLDPSLVIKRNGEVWDG